MATQKNVRSSNILGGILALGKRNDDQRSRKDAGCSNASNRSTDDEDDRRWSRSADQAADFEKAEKYKLRALQRKELEDVPRQGLAGAAEIVSIKLASSR
ncbi:MAG: hypothetical protein Q9203_004659 [Teloschistes exilis]